MIENLKRQESTIQEGLVSWEVAAHTAMDKLKAFLFYFCISKKLLQSDLVGIRYAISNVASQTEENQRIESDLYESF